MTDKQEILDIPQHLRRDTVTDDVQAMLNAAYIMEAQSAIITKLEAQLDQQKDEYEGLIDVAESNFRKLEERLDKVRGISEDNVAGRITSAFAAERIRAIVENES